MVNKMTKYTTTSLIKELEKFPTDTPIETELAFIFNYDSDKVIEECSGKTYETETELFETYKKYATELAIFEGSWEKDNISDVNNIMPKYVTGWIPSYHCNENAILKEDIITTFFQLINMIKIDKNQTEGIVLDDMYIAMNKGISTFMGELGLIEAIEEIQSKIKAQEKMCEKEKIHLFAPEDGLCFNCNKQIYNRISMEKAANELITHCPYCSRAYND